MSVYKRRREGGLQVNEEISLEEVDAVFRLDPFPGGDPEYELTFPSFLLPLFLEFLGVQAFDFEFAFLQVIRACLLEETVDKF